MKEMTKEEAKVFLRKVLGPPHRTLAGKDKDQILLLIAMIEPFKETNNQRSWTEYYMIGETEYQVTSLPDGDIIVDEMLKDEE
jgi:hypothetical protein